MRHHVEPHAPASGDSSVREDQEIAHQLNKPRLRKRPQLGAVLISGEAVE